MKNLLLELEDLRKEYPNAMTNDQCVEMLNRLAWKNKDDLFGLLHKPAGNNGVRSDGIPCSVDFITNLKDGVGVDCLINAGGGVDPDNPEAKNSIPTWGNGEPFDQPRFIPPIDLGMDNGDDDVTNEELAKKIDELSAKVDKLLVQESTGTVDQFPNYKLKIKPNA